MPFYIDIEIVPPEFQAEIIDLNCNTGPWNTFRYVRFLELYELYSPAGTHLYLVPRSRMRGAIPLHPQYVFMAWCLVKHRDNFTFTFLFTYLLSFQCLMTMHGKW
jgi:hypothetical protein